jgi:hypothetical protein
MKTSIARMGLIAVSGLLVTGVVLVGDGRDHGTRFSDFTPLSSSAPPTFDESAPVTFGNPEFQQRSIADRQTQLADLKPNSGNWDMITTNETGRDKGRYLFTVFETDQSGVQRHDLWTGETDTIWHSPTPGGHVAFDPSYWTPWGTVVTGEEEWLTVGEQGYPQIYGRLFEFRNPTTAPGIFSPLTGTSNESARFVHRNIIPRTSHEGIQFDSDLNMYFIDELNGGNIYKYTPAAHPWLVMLGFANYFAAGQTFALRVGDGNTANAIGSFTWVPFTNKWGSPLPGAVTITDANGVTSVDARNSTNLPAFKGTDYQRPEDMQMQKVRGREYLYFTTTTTHETYRIDLKRKIISVFANRNTTDLGTGLPVGAALASPDNLAIDHEGNIYIIEDRAGGVDNDIWFARDLNKDGDLDDENEGIGRWASNGTLGSEFTGLYFDPFNKRRAWVNIQHPTSRNDRTIEITIPRGDDDKNNR